MGELKRVKKEIDPKYEVGALSRLLDLNQGPAAILENVKGTKGMVVINPLQSWKRIALAFGVTTRKEAVLKCHQILKKNWVAPVVINSGRCKDVIIHERDIDLKRDIPNIYWVEGEEVAFITCGMVITKDPDTGERNVGWYRESLEHAREREMTIWLGPQNHGGMHYTKMERQNKPLEAALVVGVDPRLYLLGCTPFAIGDDELAALGALRGSPVELVKCETVDLEVPANSEYVIEGIVPPHERFDEHEHVEFHGSFSRHPVVNPVFRVTCITHRTDPIWYGVTQLRAVFPHLHEELRVQAFGREVGFTRDVKRVCPEVEVVAVPEAGASWYIAVAQISDKPYPRYADQVMHAIWSSRQGGKIKYVIVVDKDIDPYNMEEVLWAISTRSLPYEDTCFIREGHGHKYDPSVEEDIKVMSRIGIDATVKVPERLDHWPIPGEFSREIMENVKRKVEKEIEFTFEEYPPYYHDLIG
jgi:UbiD family decarboxylase